MKLCEKCVKTNIDISECVDFEVKGSFQFCGEVFYSDGNIIAYQDNKPVVLNLCNDCRRNTLESLLSSDYYYYEGAK